MKCTYCHTRLTLSDGVWVDDTDGDVCSGDDDLNNENEVHQPTREEHTMRYAIQAYIKYTDHDGYVGTTAVPTFYLDAAVQGIVSAEHAERIACDVIDPIEDMRNDDRYELTITAVAV